MIIKLSNWKFLILLILLKFSSLSAQIVYIDPEPDILISSIFNNTVSYNFDINNDSIPDLKLIVNSSWATASSYLQPLNNTFVICSGSYADTLNVNDTIGFFSNWSSANLSLASCSGSDMSGIWAKVSNKFIGVSIISGSDTLYGWLRIDISNYAKGITIKDYAFNTIPNQPIIAGDCISPKVESVTVSDVGDNKNAGDLKVNFKRAIDEKKLTEYRIIIVKESETSNFNLNSAMLIPPGNYLKIIPNGRNFSDTLQTDTKDKNGDTIKEFISYKIFVLTIVDGILAKQNSLSPPSNSITLSSPTYSATNLQAKTSFLGNTAYNINISFNKIPDESTIIEYRVIFVKAANAGAFNLDSASLIPVGGFYPVKPNGANIQLSFNSDTLNDYSSKKIAHLLSYKVFILSIADGTIANINALSLPSESFILASFTLAAKNIMAIDVSNSGNSSDMQILFNKIPDESTILAYRVIGVKLSDCNSFNLNSANSVSAGNYISLNCTGANLNFLLSDSAKDNNGNLISANIPYRFFVLSIADFIHTDINALSAQSNIITLKSPSYFKAGQKTENSVHYYDIIPDIEMGKDFHNSNDNYNIDLNNDGILDFKIHTVSTASPSHNYGGSTIEPYNFNSVCVIDEESIFPDTLRFNDMINENLYWCNKPCNFGSWEHAGVPPFTDTKSGIWWRITDRYVGLSVVISNHIKRHTIYGWLRLNLNPPHVVIKDYAWFYETTDINNKNISKNDYKIYPNPANNECYIQLPDYPVNFCNVYIYNSLCQEVLSKDLHNITEKIDISGLNIGIYYIKIISDYIVKTEKLVIAR